MKIRSLIFLLVFAPLCSWAQYSFRTIIKSDRDDWGKKIIELSNGNFVFVGRSWNGMHNAYAGCLSPKGELLWGTFYGYHNNIVDEYEATDLIKPAMVKFILVGMRPFGIANTIR